MVKSCSFIPCHPTEESEELATSEDGGHPLKDSFIPVAELLLLVLFSLLL